MISYRAKMSVWSPLAAADPLAGSGLGTVAVTLGSLNLLATGTVANQVSHGTLAATLGPLTLTATASAQATGSLGVTLDSLGLAAFGTVANQGVVTGTLHATLDPLTLSAAGSVSTAAAAGTLAATLGALALHGSGTVANRVFHGTLSATLGALALSAAGHVTTSPRTGTLNVTLGPVALTAFGRGVVIPTSWPHEWCPALGPTRSTTLAVDVVQFGDGYCHRSTRGLNPAKPTISYAFPFENTERLSEMDTFLKTYGARGFAFQPPDEAAPIFVCCNQWSATLTARTGSDDIVGSLTSVFEQMFNAQPISPLSGGTLWPHGTTRL